MAWSSLSSADAQLAVGLLQGIGRCTPVLGSTIDSLCTLILTIITKVEEAENVRSSVKELVEDAVQIAGNVYELLRDHPEMNFWDDRIVKSLHCLLRSMEDIAAFVQKHIKKRFFKRLLASSSDRIKVEDLQRNLNKGLRVFTMSVTSQMHSQMCSMRTEMAVMGGKVDSMQQMMRNWFERQDCSGSESPRPLADRIVEHDPLPCYHEVPSATMSKSEPSQAAILEEVAVSGHARLPDVELIPYGASEWEPPPNDQPSSESEVPVPAIVHTAEPEASGYALREEETVQLEAVAQMEANVATRNSSSKPPKRSDTHAPNDDDCPTQLEEDPLTRVKRIKDLLEDVSKSLECPLYGRVFSDSKPKPKIRDAGGGGRDFGTILPYTQKCFKLFSRLIGYLQGIP